VEGKEGKTRASASDVRPTTSKVRELRTDVLTEPITLDLDPTRPVSFLADPERIIPHSKIPKDVKESIIETYGEKFFVEREWSVGQVTKLARIISYPRENMNNTVAQICGASCTMKDACPYDIAGKPPAGERCPIELRTSREYYNEYVTAVADRLNITEEQIESDIVVHNIIWGIVESDMIELRLNGVIAEDGMIIEVPAVVNQETGEVYYKEEESAAMRIKERVAKRRDQLLRQLLATPEMAAKYKRKGEQDNVARGAKLLDKLERAVSLLEKNNDIKDAEVVDGS
jgi:hypothetical protein